MYWTPSYGGYLWNKSLAFTIRFCVGICWRMEGRFEILNVEGCLFQDHRTAVSYCIFRSTKKLTNNFYRKSNLLFLWRQCCSLHILREWPMERALRHLCFVVELTVARGGGLGHSPTSRHHCFSVTATLDTFTLVLFSVVFSEHFSSPARGILGDGDNDGDPVFLLLWSHVLGGMIRRHQSSRSFEGAVLVM